MADRGRLRLLVWCLGAFHASLLLLLAVLVVYLRSDLGKFLDAQGTVLGLLLFGALWLATWLGARRALYDGWVLIPRMFLGQLRPPGYGLVGGATAGAVTAVLSVLINYGDSLISGNWHGVRGIGEFTVIEFLAIAPVSAVIGAVVGAILGYLFGVVDALLLWAALSIVGPDELEDDGPQGAEPEA